MDQTKFTYDDTVQACAGCKQKFFSGDVAVLFQNAADLRVSFLCADCTMRQLELGHARPVGASVHLAAKWKGVDVEELPPETRARVLEGFAIVERLVSALGSKP